MKPPALVTSVAMKDFQASSWGSPKSMLPTRTIASNNPTSAAQLPCADTAHDVASQSARRYAFHSPLPDVESGKQGLLLVSAPCFG